MKSIPNYGENILAITPSGKYICSAYGLDLLYLSEENGWGWLFEAGNAIRDEVLAVEVTDKSAWNGSFTVNDIEYNIVDGQVTPIIP